MDPITHGLLGACTAYAVTAPKLNRHAWKVGALAGMAPDLDIFIRSHTDPLLFFIYHRQFTHALIFIPLGALIVSLFYLMICKTVRPLWRYVYLASICGYATHCLLDSCTSYGTQLFWPFSAVRYSWDCMPIVDPIFTSILAITLLLAVKKDAGKIAAYGLAVALVYIGFGVFQHQRALHAQVQLAKANNLLLTRQREMPIIGQLLYWRGIFQSNDNLYITTAKAPILGKSIIELNFQHPAFSKQQLPEYIQYNPVLLKDFTTFNWFADNYLIKVDNNPLTLCDMRFTRLYPQPTCLWGIVFPNNPQPQQHIQMAGQLRINSQ
jgi:inner membrane protein